MRTTGFVTSILKPLTATRVSTQIRARSTAHSLEKFAGSRITTLLPHNNEHFEVFRRILTDKNVVFTSSWIDKWFGIQAVRKKCEDTAIMIKLVLEGDDDVVLPPAMVEAYKKGVPPLQISLNRFFSLPDNQEKLRKLYLEMTKYAEATGLGYYKFEDKDENLIGGGALAPISDQLPIQEVDLALHILKSSEGAGTYFIRKLLQKAFEECGVKQVWATSSSQTNPISPILCAGVGMITHSNDGIRNHDIDIEMWKAMKHKILSPVTPTRSGLVFYDDILHVDKTKDGGNKER